MTNLALALLTASRLERRALTELDEEGSSPRNTRFGRFWAIRSHALLPVGTSATMSKPEARSSVVRMPLRRSSLESANSTLQIGGVWNWPGNEVNIAAADAASHLA